MTPEEAFVKTRGHVVLTGRGGVQLEWHRDGVDLEIEFKADANYSGPAKFSYEARVASSGCLVCHSNGLSSATP